MDIFHRPYRKREREIVDLSSENFSIYLPIWKLITLYDNVDFWRGDQTIPRLYTNIYSFGLLYAHWQTFLLYAIYLE